MKWLQTFRNMDLFSLFGLCLRIPLLIDFNLEIEMKFNQTQI